MVQSKSHSTLESVHEALAVLGRACHQPFLFDLRCIPPAGLDKALEFPAQRAISLANPGSRFLFYRSLGPRMAVALHDAADQEGPRLHFIPDRLHRLHGQ
jgi:hypothetical protein